MKCMPPGIRPCLVSRLLHSVTRCRNTGSISANKPKEAQELLRYDGVDEERTKLVLVSAAVSLRESMRLLAREAADCAKAVDTDKRALDLANFDCYACHHDLKSPSWRQKRGYAGKPGRVPMRPWPTALVKLAIHQAAKDAEAGVMEDVFTKKWQRLQAAFEAKPFGDAKKIAPAADDLANWAERSGRETGEQTVRQSRRPETAPAAAFAI